MLEGNRSRTAELLRCDRKKPMIEIVGHPREIPAQTIAETQVWKHFIGVLCEDPKIVHPHIKFVSSQARSDGAKELGCCFERDLPKQGPKRVLQYRVGVCNRDAGPYCRYSKEGEIVKE